VSSSDPSTAVDPMHRAILTGAVTSISNGVLFADGLVLRNGYLQPVTGQLLAVPYKAGKFEWGYKDTAFELSARSIEPYKVRQATILPTMVIHLERGDTHHYHRCPFYPRWREICEATHRHDTEPEGHCASHLYLKCSDVPSVVQAGVSLHCEHPSYMVPPSDRRVHANLSGDPQGDRSQARLLSTDLLRQVLSVPVAQKAPIKALTANLTS
jgi:hypothetical protein